jgi:CHAD domain-containing protein
MAFRFNDKEPAHLGVKRIAKERLERTIKALSQQPDPDAEAIHDARKDLKSLRALLRLARSAIDPEIRQKENACFRDVGRALSVSRDSQALIEALDLLRKGSRPTNGARQPELRELIASIRAELEREADRHRIPDNLKLLLQQLRGASRRVGRWLRNSAPDEEWSVIISPGLVKTYRDGRKLVKEFAAVGLDNVADEAWHELRKLTKALGYQLRLLRDLWPGPIRALQDEVDHLGETLGQDHDLVVLRQRVLQMPFSAEATQNSAEARHALIESIARKQKKLRQTAMGLASRVNAERPKEFEHRFARYWSCWRKVEANDRQRSARLHNDRRSFELKPHEETIAKDPQRSATSK